MNLPDSSFDSPVAFENSGSSRFDDPGFPILTAVAIGLGELVTVCTLILPGTMFKLIGYLTGVLVTLPAIGLHRQLLRRRTALAGVVSTSTGELFVKMFAFLGMCFCVANAVLLALAWSH